MNVSSIARDPRHLVHLVSLLLATALIGFAIGEYGPIVGILLFGVAGAALMVVRPDFGLLAVAVTVPLENLIMFRDGVTGTRILAAGAIGAWILHRLIWGGNPLPLLGSRFVLYSTLFVGFALASVLWAWQPNVALVGAIQLIQLFLFAVMIADLASDPRTADRLVKALLLSAAIAAAFTLQQFFQGSFRRAGDQISGGVNGTAVLLLTIVPFGFYLFRASHRLVWKIVGFAYVVASAIAIPLTFSRMNLLLLIPVLLLLCVLTMVGRSGRGWVFALLLGTAIVGATVAPWERILLRTETIVPYLRSSVGGGVEEPVASGRGYHLQVGLAIARDHPLIGVGYQNYGHFFLREYQFTVPGTDRIYNSPRSPHSSHVGILADLGIVGFSFWILLLFAFGVRYLLLAWRTASATGSSDLKFLIEATLVALVLHAVPYGFYLPNQREKVVWILLALSYAVWRISQDGLRAPRPI